ANTADERWQWRKVKQKNDRRDALKAAQLSAVNQLCPVHVPELTMRQWRALIAYRAKLVQRRTKIKNHIRDLLLREGQLLPHGRAAWTQAGMATLAAIAQPFTTVDSDQLWRGEVGIDVAQPTPMQLQTH